jgi:adenylate cyclase, class 2
MRTPAGNTNFIPRRLCFCRAGQSGEVRARAGLEVYCLAMPKAAHREEIEIKLRAPDLSAVHRRLRQLHAREISPRTYESNTLFDTPAKDLRRHNRLIRIRIEQPARRFGKKRADESGAAILTYKGPPPSSRVAETGGGKARVRGHFKVREEAEVPLAGAGQMARILRGLGLHPVFRYEKFRTTYVLPGIRGLKIELDETPVGSYLELEGSIAGIDRAARLLDYTRAEYLTETYGSLYLADCRRRGRKPGHMLFPPTKKTH